MICREKGERGDRGRERGEINLAAKWLLCMLALIVFHAAVIYFFTADVGSDSTKLSNIQVF